CEQLQQLRGSKPHFVQLLVGLFDGLALGVALESHDSRGVNFVKLILLRTWQVWRIDVQVRSVAGLSAQRIRRAVATGQQLEPDRNQAAFPTLAIEHRGSSSSSKHI